MKFRSSVIHTHTNNNTNRLYIKEQAKYAPTKNTAEIVIVILDKQRTKHSLIGFSLCARCSFRCWEYSTT